MLSRILAALMYPVSESRVLVPLIVFSLLIALAAVAGLLGLVLLVLTLLAVFRYLCTVLEARAQGRTPATPDSEFFSLVGLSWSLFPLAISLLVGMATLWIEPVFGLAGKLLVWLVASVVVPPMLLILVVTHSVVESLNPLAIGRMFQRCGAVLWIASVFLVITGLLLNSVVLPATLLTNLLQLILLFSFFSLLGSLAEPYAIIDEVRIPDDVVVDDTVALSDKARTRELSHAYGFISRDNRDGGFRHLISSIEAESDVAGAWSWYFERMLLWESKEPALFFARHYLHDLLRHGETLVAVKLILRCQYLDPSWRPDGTDRDAAISAARSSGNLELAATLQQH